MVKTVSSPSSLLAVLVAGVVALGVVWLLHLGHVEASSHSATRSFAPAPASVPAGGELEVTITASNYGGFWGVAETLPDGFTYVEGSVAPSDVRVREDGQTVNFTLLGGESLAYSSWPVCNRQAHWCPGDEARGALQGFGTSPPKAFTLVQQKFDKRRPDPESGYFHHSPRVSTRRTHRSSSRFARALRVS